MSADIMAMEDARFENSRGKLVAALDPSLLEELQVFQISSDVR